MTESGGSIYVAFIDSNVTWDIDKCLKIYSEVLEHIKGKIEEFNRPENNVCKECLKFNEYINNKDKEFSECYKQPLLRAFLNDSDEINVFIENCAKYSICPNNPPNSAKGHVNLKAKTEYFCEAKNDCVGETKPEKQQSESKAEKSESQPAIDAKTPETGNAKGQTHDNQGINTENSYGQSISLNTGGLELNAQGSHVNTECNVAGTGEASNQSAADSHVDAGRINPVRASSGNVTLAATSTHHAKTAAIPYTGQADDVVTADQGSSHSHVVIEIKGDITPACVTPSATCLDSKCTDDGNLSQPDTCNSAPLNETVRDGGTGKLIRNADSNNHLSSFVTSQNTLSPKNNSDTVEDKEGKVTHGDGYIILNKKNILMSLIPLAIILLLTFLVKVSQVLLKYKNYLYFFNYFH